jgi:hypothetical protein
MQTWTICHQMATPILCLSLHRMMRLIRQRTLQISFFRTFRTSIITTFIRGSKIRISSKMKWVSKIKNKIRISSKMKRVRNMKRVSKTHGKHWQPGGRTTKGGLPGIPLHPLKLRYKSLSIKRAVWISSLLGVPTNMWRLVKKLNPWKEMTFN